MTSKLVERGTPMDEAMDLAARVVAGEEIPIPCDEDEHARSLRPTVPPPSSRARPRG
jgi:hypothetical protein